MKILHIISSVGHGGAQKILADIINADRERAEHHVISLVEGEPFFKMHPASLQSLLLRRGQISLRGIRTLRRFAGGIQPDVIHAWLYHGNFASTFIKDMSPKLVWSIHNTTLDPKQSKRSTRLIDRVCSKLSWWLPDRIVYVSPQARAVHERIGYDATKGIVIENGIDLNRFASCDSRVTVRQGLKVSDQDILVGCIARYDPQKDHRSVIDAVSRAAQTNPNLRLMLVGEGCSNDNLELRMLLQNAGIAQRTILLGVRDDIPSILSALDLLVIGSAFGEALPLIGLEAAAVGIPVVATAVGDVHSLVLEPGDVVPPRSPDAMSAAILRVSGRGRQDDQRRGVLEQRFSLEKMLESYRQLYGTAASSAL
jgi:glycosyltransferase involved in cell wall biosynthesis